MSFGSQSGSRSSESRDCVKTVSSSSRTEAVLELSSMELTTLCTVVATLRVSPDRSQFFQYEQLSLSCSWRGNSSGWRVMWNSSHHTNQARVNFNPGSEASYFLSAAYQSDSGVYWCQSAAGERSHAVHITVTDGPVILESPALPVAEGDAVTLRCRSAKPSSPTLRAAFYRDGVSVGDSSTGHMTIHNISRAGGGVYKCRVGAGDSPESQLTVMATGSAPSPESSCCTQDGEPPAPGRLRALLPVAVVGGVVLLVALLLVCIWRKRRGVSNPCARPDETHEDVAYTVVTISQNVPPRGIKGPEEADTLYSTVRPGHT